jgi:hypothetical protein
MPERRPDSHHRLFERLVPTILFVFYALILIVPTLAYPRERANHHEIGFAYYPALLALETRAQLVSSQSDPSPSDNGEWSVRQFLDTSRSYYYFSGYSYGMFVFYYLLFLFFGKTLPAMSLAYISCHLLVVFLVYRLTLLLEKDSSIRHYTALFASIMTATAPAYLHYTLIETALPEETVSLAVAMAVLYFYIRASLKRQPTTRKMLLLGLGCALVTFIKPHLGFLLCAAVVIHLLVEHGKMPRQAFRLAGVATASFGVAAIIIVLGTIGWERLVFWIFLRSDDLAGFGSAFALIDTSLGMNPPVTIVQAMLRWYLGWFDSGASSYGLAFLALMFFSLRNMDSGTRLLWILVALSMAIGVLFFFRIGFALVDYLYTIFPPFFILIALGIARVLRRAELWLGPRFATVGRAGALVTLAFFTSGTLLEYTDAQGPRRDNVTPYRNCLDLPVELLVDSEPLQSGLIVLYEISLGNAWSNPILWQMLGPGNLHPVNSFENRVSEDVTTPEVGKLLNSLSKKGYRSLLLIAVDDLSASRLEYSFWGAPQDSLLAGAAAAATLTETMKRLGWYPERTLSASEIEVQSDEFSCPFRLTLFRNSKAVGQNRTLSPVEIGYSLVKE